jgi:superoxide dismutase, Fe-Mn family
MRNLLFFFVFLLIGTVNVTAQFTQEALPYAFDALEPSIDARTMEIHYGKHHAAYVSNLNAALKEAGREADRDIEAILANISSYSPAVRNNGGGHYNHTLFWNILTPERGSRPSDRLLQAINAQFGDMERLKTTLNREAATRFGSGWAWLVVTPDKRLAVTSTPNQDNPLMNIVPLKGTPILGIDVWEHAYYLKYQNRRGDYLQAIWDVINWKTVSELYDTAMRK